MTREEIEAKVRTIVSEHLNVGLERVTPDARLIEDLGADSLDQVELVMAAEEEFHVEIPDSEGADMVTAKDVVDWLARKLIPADGFQPYRRSQIAELRPWQPGDNMIGVSVSAPDREAGSPKAGDMIARNPKNHADVWLVAAQYFADNFEPA